MAAFNEPTPEFQAQMDQLKALLKFREEEKLEAQKARRIGTSTFEEQVATTNAVLQNDKKLKQVSDTLNATREAGKKGFKRSKRQRAFDFVRDEFRFVQANFQRIRGNKLAGVAFKTNLQEFKFQTDFLQTIVKQNQSLLKGIGVLITKFDEFLSQGAANALKSLEDKRENQALLEKLAMGGGGVASGLRTDAERQDFNQLGLGQILLRLIPFLVLGLSAFFSELSTKIRETLKIKRIATPLKAIGSLFGAITDAYRKAGTGKFLKGNTIKVFGRGTKGVIDFFTRVKKFLAPVTKAVNSVKGFLLKGGKTTGSAITKFVNTIRNITAPIRNFLGKQSGKVLKFGKTLGRLFTRFTGLSRFMGPLSRVASTVGKLAGKLFLPLTFAIEGITGFFKRFKSVGEDVSLGQKILAGLLGAIEGILGGFIAFPLDLLKNGLAFILDKFGLDGIAEAMRGFSFKEARTKIFDNIIGFFTGKSKEATDDEGGGIFAKIKSAIGGFFDMIREKITNFFKPVTDFVSKLGAAIKAGIAALKPGGLSPKEAFMAVLQSGASPDEVRDVDQRVRGFQETEEGRAFLAETGVGAGSNTGAKIEAAASRAQIATTRAITSVAENIPRGFKVLGDKITDAMGGGKGAPTVNNVTYQVAGHQEQNPDNSSSYIRGITG